MHKQESVWSAIFLVAGTCIGGGMLALPVATGISGFFPSLAMMAICWFAMTASALLLLEANLWLKEGAHVITMSSVILGPVGKIVSWLLYLFISYASLVAYTAAGGDLLISAFESFLPFAVTKELGCFLFIVIFGSVIYLGSHIVGRVNTILFIALIIAYVGLVTKGLPEVKSTLLTYRKWQTSFLAIPLLLTTFSFQTMLPSLTPFLNRNVKALRWAIIGGTTVTFIVYALWQLIVLGIMPLTGPYSLIDALEAGSPVTQFLRSHVNSDLLGLLADYFAFFALVTSFLGIGLGLFDFLSDGLNLQKTGWQSLILGFLVMVPTFVFATYFERIFLVALETTGGFGDTILNGMMPVLMVWIGRYYLHFPKENRLPGGKLFLGFVFLLFLTALILELLLKIGAICSIMNYCQALQKDYLL